MFSVIYYDCNFTISSNDLGEAVKRVGGSAKDANLNLDELINLMSTIKHTTNKNGTAIGNALKFILLRLSNKEIIKELEQLNIIISNDNTAMEKIQIISKKLETLSTERITIIIELIGGIYQANIFKSLLKDINNKDSIYYQVINMLKSK